MILLTVRLAEDLLQVVLNRSIIITFDSGGHAFSSVHLAAYRITGTLLHVSGSDSQGRLAETSDETIRSDYLSHPC